MAFIKALSKSESKNSNGLTVTDNGALSHASSGDGRLNYFSKVLRDTESEQVLSYLTEAWLESPLDAMRLVAQKRDCRGGAGEKKVFYESMRWCVKQHPKVAAMFLPLVPVYGTWKDGYFCFCDTAMEDMWLKHVAQQLKADMVILQTEDDEEEDSKGEKKGKSISLCAKWVPSEGSSIDRKFGGIYERLARVMELPAGNRGLKQLRVTYLSPLREFLNIVERLMCGGKWSDITYEHVPSVAMNRLRKAFAKKDAERFKEYLDQVSSGKKKINSGQLFPHQMVKSYLHGAAFDQVIEEQWKAYVKKTKALGQLDQAVIVSDVSGSMSSAGRGKSTDKDLPLQVSIALGLLVSTITKGAFNGSVITFHETPSFYKIDTSAPLKTQVDFLKSAPWGGNTNFQAVFDLILSTATKNHLKQADMPKTLIVVSDMQFDQAGGEGFFTNFEVIKAKYRKAGYTMPKIVFWNVAGGTTDFPVTKDEFGVAMVAGFSPSILKYITAGVITSPYELMRDVIDSERYAQVDVPASYK
jgi:hypothetical protein